MVFHLLLSACTVCGRRRRRRQGAVLPPRGANYKYSSRAAASATVAGGREAATRPGNDSHVAEYCNSSIIDIKYLAPFAATAAATDRRSRNDFRF